MELIERQAKEPNMTNQVTQEDIEAVKWFHKHAVKWVLDAIIRDDPIGEDRDLNHPVYQAFARHRIAAEQRGAERAAQIIDLIEMEPYEAIGGAKRIRALIEEQKV